MSAPVSTLLPGAVTPPDPGAVAVNATTTPLLPGQPEFAASLQDATEALPTRVVRPAGGSDAPAVQQPPVVESLTGHRADAHDPAPGPDATADATTDAATDAALTAALAGTVLVTTPTTPSPPPPPPSSSPSSSGSFSASPSAPAIVIPMARPHASDVSRSDSAAVVTTSPVAQPSPSTFPPPTSPLILLPQTGQDADSATTSASVTPPVAPTSPATPTSFTLPSSSSSHVGRPSAARDAPTVEQLAAAAVVTAAPPTVTPAAAPPVVAPASTPAAVPVHTQLSAVLSPLKGGKSGEHQLTVQLHPAELGAVTLVARMEHGGITVELTSGSDAARSALVSALPNLRQDLADAGFGSVNVNVGSGWVGAGSPDASSGGSPNWRPSPANDQQFQGNPAPTTTPRLPVGTRDLGLDRWL